MAYAAREKYDEPGRAARYRERSPRREKEEWRLLARCLDRLATPPADALDVPCGTGRVAAHLIDRGIPTRCADLSPAMRASTRERLSGRPGFRGVSALDLERPGDAGDHAADLVVCFRFLHHLPDADTRARVLETLARLTRRDLLLSFHHPLSAHGLTRRVRAWLRRRPSDRYTLRPRVLAREASAAGLTLQHLDALGRYRRELWVAHLARSS